MKKTVSSFRLRGIPALLACLLAFCWPNLLSAQLYEVPLPERNTQAALVVEGVVTGQSSFWDERQGYIYTANVLEIHQVFKGETLSDTLELLTYGGQVGDRMISVEHSLQLGIGERGIFFCQHIGSEKAIPLGDWQRFLPYADAQGMLRFLPDGKVRDYFSAWNSPEEARALVEGLCGKAAEVRKPPLPHTGPPKSFVASISGLSPGTVSAGTETELTVNGSGFLAVQGTQAIVFRNADDGGGTWTFPAAAHYVSWSDTEVRVRVPKAAGTGTIGFYDGISVSATSAGTLTVSYAILNAISGVTPYIPDHVSLNNLGGYDFKMHTDLYNSASAREAMLRALRTLTCGTGVNFTFTVTSSVDVVSADATSIIRYDNGTELPSGVLGRMTSYWSGCNTSVWTVTELDLAMDDGSSWYYGTGTPGGSQFDFESVALHEFGHGHQWGHVIAGTNVMHYAVSSGVTRRALNADNLSAGTYMMGKSTAANACGIGPMTTASCPAATDADFYADVTTVYTNQTITFTDASYGTVTSRAWNFGDATSSSALQPTKSYSTAGKYLVTLDINGGGGALTEAKTNYIHVLPHYTPPYTLAQGGDLESNPNDFGTAGVGQRWSIWELGAPSNVINTTASGSNVWKTDLDANIGTRRNVSAVYSPSFNFSSAGTYSLTFSYQQRVTFSNAPYGVWVERTTDNGSTWVVLGSFTGANNWYSTNTHSVVSGSNCWSHNRNSYATATQDVSSLAGNAKVAFRIAFEVEEIWAGGYDVDGFAFDNFAIAATLLPVELTFFRAKKQGKSAQLVWQTASEQHSDHFAIERSTPGRPFEAIGTVLAQGNSLQMQDYSFLDENPQPGINYYRLRQVDLDGQYDLSQLETVVFEEDGVSFSILQNPMRKGEELQIAYLLPEEGRVEVQVFSMSGLPLKNEALDAVATSGILTMPMNDLPQGVYFVKTSFGQQTKTLRLVKL